jgi:hypothetical protein
VGAYPSIIKLAGLDGDTGFRIDGVAADDQSGFSVASAGDVNGDGIGDIIVGAWRADIAGRINTGAGYVVFGKAQFSATMDLGSLNGTNGFRLEGIDPSDQTGRSVASAGDVNDDGYDDVIIGAPISDAGGGFAAGSSYVVFGDASGFPASLPLSALDGSNGFRVDGAAMSWASGVSVSSAGDLNDDGFADLVVGALGVNNGVGAAFVILGKTHGFAASMSLASLDDGSNGFRLDGSITGGRVGAAVASAGDVNGDGVSDVIVGSGSTDMAYVVFGQPEGFGASMSLGSLDGANGFAFTGLQPEAAPQGTFVGSAGDLNGDGLSDMVVGSPAAGSGSGTTFVVFGSAEAFAPTIDLTALNGSDGFALFGANGESSGHAVSGAGDFNGDGFDDLIVSAHAADPSGRVDAGSAYLLFGRASGFGSHVDLASLNGRDGLRLDGVGAGDGSAWSVASAGDLNGDGLDDLIIGATGADPGSDAEAGSSYVVFGRLPGAAVRRTGSDIGQTIHGGDLGDTLSGLGGDDVLIGHDGDDVINGGTGDDDMQGGDGEDAFIAGNGNDTFAGGAGLDRISYGGGAHALVLDLDAGTAAVGTDEIDTLISIEQVTATRFADVLTGGVAAETIIGGGGRDRITGAAGADVMTGGAGADRFIFLDLFDSAALRADTITDLAAGDVIDLRRVDADYDKAGNQAFHIVSAFTGHAGELDLRYGAAKNWTFVSGDVNGDKAADFTIVLQNGDYTDFTGFLL